MNLKPDALILAAGLSSRMNHFKPLLPYNNSTFIESIIMKLFKHVNSIIIVTGHNSHLLIDFLENKLSKRVTNLNFIYNQDYSKGMLGSLQLGISRVSKDTRWLLYHFVDQPHLPQSFYFNFIEQIDEKYQWLQPEYEGKKGHPILINHTLFNPILQIPSNKNLKSLSGINKKMWWCEYRGILQDIDWYEDYLALRSSKN